MSKLCIVLLVVSMILLGVSLYYQLKANDWIERFDIPLKSISSTTLSVPNTDYYPHIVRTEPVEPNEEEISRKFNECIASEQDTVKGCLTSSGAGFRPAVCMNLCKQQYGELSKYCTSVCNNQQQQVNTSARNGPA